MLTEIYIEALLVDEDLADHVWEDWDAGAINNHTAFVAWLDIVSTIRLLPLSDDGQEKSRI